MPFRLQLPRGKRMETDDRNVYHNKLTKNISKLIKPSNEQRH